MTALHVIVMAKAPQPGQVKTRLCPPCTPHEAAEVAEAALADTLAAVGACRAARKVVALDGPPGPWLPPGFELLRQRGTDFNHRLASAWIDAGGPGLQIGMDTPQVTAAEIDLLLARLDQGRRPAVFGPADDGGWWAIGWRRGDPEAVFSGLPMSTPATGAAQLARLRSLGFDVIRAEPKRDIDTVEDLAAVASAEPRLRTARLARRLGIHSPAAVAG